MSINLQKEDKEILLEALGEMMFKISMRLEAFKGQPNTQERKELSKRQKRIEALQHNISILQ